MIEERISGWTVGALWTMLSPAQRRDYLLASGAKVRAVRGEYELTGDVQSVAAFGFWDLVTGKLDPAYDASPETLAALDSV